MNDPGIPTNLEKLQEELRQRLRGQARELRVVGYPGHVLLEGIAATYYAKQLAQHIVLHVLGETVLVNRIDVQRTTAPPNCDETREA